MTEKPSLSYFPTSIPILRQGIHHNSPLGTKMVDCTILAYPTEMLRWRSLVFGCGRSDWETILLRKFRKTMDRGRRRLHLVSRHYFPLNQRRTREPREGRARTEKGTFFVTKEWKCKIKGGREWLAICNSILSYRSIHWLIATKKERRRERERPSRWQNRGKKRSCLRARVCSIGAQCQWPRQTEWTGRKRRRLGNSSTNWTSCSCDACPPPFDEQSPDIHAFTRSFTPKALILLCDNDLFLLG